MITIGQQVTIKPEWQDEGDSDYIWIAISEPNPHTGYFKARVTAKNPSEDSIRSIMDLRADQVESCVS
jgi:hypothetical protein